MAQNPTSRRKVATPDPEPISKPTVKRQLNPSTTTTSTVYNLTDHFSRLNPNPNPQSVKSQKYPPPQKLIDARLQAKALSKSATFEPSKPSKVVKQGKRVVSESGKEVVKEGNKTQEVEEKTGQNEEVVVIKVMRPKEIVSGIGKRRSLCDAKMELANFLLTNCAKVVSADMPPFIQIHAVGFARKTKDSLEKFSSKNLGLSLKKEFDEVYGPAWHCIVGTSFGSFVTHSVGGFLYFSLDQKVYVLLFKTTVQRAE